MNFDLIAELEQAQEGSRDLSDRALLASGWTFKDTGDPRSEAWMSPDGKSYDWWDDPHARSRDLIPHRPNPTHDIQDALDWMVPKGWQWQVSNRAPSPHGGRAYIHTDKLQNIGPGGMTPNPEYRGEECTAATPALALCIACLKAMCAS